MTKPPAIAIIIPARYGSTRFPGKPLAMLGGKTILSRVVDIARHAAEGRGTTTLAVATEDDRIAAHARELGVAVLMTDPSCSTGSDRVLAAARQLKNRPDFILNVQGDAPFIPPAVLNALLDEMTPGAEVLTPVHQLSWSDLDRLRENKKTTPFSGTTATIGTDHRALWFSKIILPAMRGEDQLRKASPLSPVWQHLGVYGYSLAALNAFCALTPGVYETLEGLEQLRFLENNIPITCVPVDIKPGAIHAGIDTPEDLARAERFLTS